MNWVIRFLEILERLLEKRPPYWIFLFISAAFVIVSLITKDYFKETWALFLYSAIGTFWRHATNDLAGGIKKWLKTKYEGKTLGEKLNNLDLQRRIIYQTGNLVLFLALFFYLDYLQFIKIT